MSTTIQILNKRNIVVPPSIFQVSAAGGITPTSSLAALGYDPNASIEPPGYQTFFEMQFGPTLPPNGGGLYVNATTGAQYGVLSGQFARQSATATIGIDPAAPHGQYYARFLYPAGMNANINLGPINQSPGIFNMWDADFAARYTGVYEELYFRLPNPTFEFQAVGTKVFGYMYRLPPGGGAPNNKAVILCQWTSDNSLYVPAVMTDDSVIYPASSSDDATSLSLHQAIHQTNSTLNGPHVVHTVACGPTWHKREHLTVLDQPGVFASGILKQAFDGVLTQNYNNIRYRGVGDTNGWAWRHYDPVWGGSGGAKKTRDDYLDLAYIRLSGIP